MFFFLIILSFAGGCGAVEHRSGRGVISDENLEIEPTSELSWESNGLQQLVDRISSSQLSIEFANGESGALSTREAAALGQCGCGGDWFEKWLLYNNKRRGALHQALVPEIRKSVAESDELKHLLSLPKGIQNIVQKLTEIDGQITDAIRTELMTSMDRFLPKDVESDKASKFFFDGFSGLNFDAEANKNGGFIAVEEQAAAWLLSLSTGSALTPDPSLISSRSMLISILRILSEWTYAFGMDARKGGGRFGGLMFDPYANSSGRLRHFDPRSDDFVGLFSGQYQVFYPAANALKLATEVREVWQREKSVPRLHEQALIWSSAARLFHLLKPTSRGRAIAIFGDSAVLPSDVHELPLAILLQMEKYLDGGFIDVESRAVFSNLRVDQSEDQATASELDVDLLRSILQLADSVLLWQVTLADIDQQNLDLDKVQQIQKAETSFKRLARFLAQKMLGISWDAAAIEKYGLGLLSRYALMLSQLERTAFSSDLLLQRLSLVLKQVIKLLHAKIATEAGGAVSFEDIAWVAGLLNDLDDKRLSQPGNWVSDLKQFVELGLEGVLTFD